MPPTSRPTIPARVGAVIHRFAFLAACLAMSADCPRAAAWNPLGHKLVGEIAWQQLDPDTRKKIADTIKRHPRFAEDFAPQMPAEETDR